MTNRPYGRQYHRDIGGFLRIRERKGGPNQTKGSIVAVWLAAVKRFRVGLVFKALRLVHHSTLGLRVIKKMQKKSAHHYTSDANVP